MIARVLGIGGGLALALGVVMYLYMRNEVSSAEGARDVAREQLVTAHQETAACLAALETERVSTRVAADAAARCATENANLASRGEAALAGCGADVARLRRVLAKSQTDDALIERSGELFK